MRRVWSFSLPTSHFIVSNRWIGQALTERDLLFLSLAYRRGYWLAIQNCVLEKTGGWWTVCASQTSDGGVHNFVQIWCSSRQYWQHPLGNLESFRWQTFRPFSGWPHITGYTRCGRWQNVIRTLETCKGTCLLAVNKALVHWIASGAWSIVQVSRPSKTAGMSFALPGAFCMTFLRKSSCAAWCRASGLRQNLEWREQAGGRNG